MKVVDLLPAATQAKESFRKFAEQITGWQVKDTNIKKISVRTFSNRIKKEVVSDICVGQELNYYLVATLKSGNYWGILRGL